MVSVDKKRYISRPSNAKPVLRIKFQNGCADSQIKFLISLQPQNSMSEYAFLQRVMLQIGNCKQHAQQLISESPTWYIIADFPVTIHQGSQRCLIEWTISMISTQLFPSIALSGHSFSVSLVIFHCFINLSFNSFLLLLALFFCIHHYFFHSFSVSIAFVLSSFLLSFFFTSFLFRFARFILFF